MSAKSNADLTAENNSVIGNQTSPESITPTTDSAFRKNIIDSFWNKTDDTFLPAKFQSAILNPAAMTGASALMMGLAGSITPVRTGSILINISGEYVSNDTATDTTFTVKMGTGTVPSNGNADTGTSVIIIPKLASSATLRIPFSINTLVVGLTPAQLYWIDMAISNNSGTSVQLFNVSISVIEQ